MITLIEAKNYRCLQYIRQPLGPFHVLVGPNASGKTTFLDVVAFLGDLVSGGLDEAVGKRTSNFHDLIWGRNGGGFELAVEAQIPADVETHFSGNYDIVRYEVGFGVDTTTGEFRITDENLLLKPSIPAESESSAALDSSSGRLVPASIVSAEPDDLVRYIMERSCTAEGLFTVGHFETTKEPLIDNGPRESVLGLRATQQAIPISSWMITLLRKHVHQVLLDGSTLRQASRPGQVRTFKSDGSNLPWLIESFRSQSRSSYDRWIAHLQTALPDLMDIDTVEREDDRHRYLVLCFDGGLRVPSWMASDGTLRLIALTLIAYLPDIQGVYLIEEPENGIHPRAIETMFQSVSSVYGAQILLATHSPVILSMAEASDILCFAKTPEGAADIVRGSEHPALSSSHGETNLGVLFASGVLG